MLWHSVSCTLRTNDCFWWENRCFVRQTASHSPVHRYVRVLVLSSTHPILHTVSPWESEHRPSSRSDSGCVRTASTPANDVRWWRATRTPMSRPTSALGGASTGCHWLIWRISRAAASASSDTRGSCGRDQRCAPASRVGPFHLRAFWYVLYKLSGSWDLATSRVGLRRSFELTAARLGEEGIDKPPRALAPEGRRGSGGRLAAGASVVSASVWKTWTVRRSHRGVDAPQRLVEPVSRSERRRIETFHALILALESRRCPSLCLRETPSVCVLEQTQLARAGTCGQAPARGGRFTLALMGSWGRGSKPRRRGG